MAVRGGVNRPGLVAADTAMDRYAGGDHAAFSELYDAVAPRLYASVMRTVQEHTRAEDLVQQTLLQMHCARDRFLRGSRVMPWALTILRRLLVDQTRRKTIEVLSFDGGEDRQHSSGPNPEDATQAKELDLLVRRELLRLSPAQLVAVEAVYYGELTHAETAECLGVTIASVKLRVYRAHEAMREILRENAG